MTTSITKKFSFAIFFSIFFLILPAFPVKTNAAPSASKRFSSIYSGRIIIDNKSEEPWYINPDDLSRVYLGSPEEALSILLSLSIGISNKNFKNIPLETEKRIGNIKLINRLTGRVIVKVQDKRKAYYINPLTRKASPLLTSQDAERLINNAPKLGKSMLERIALSEYNPLLEESSDNDTDEDGLSDFDEILSGTSPFKAEPDVRTRIQPLTQDTSLSPISTSTSTIPYNPTPSITTSTTTATSTPPSSIPDLIATLPYLITGVTNRVVTLAGAVMPLSQSVYVKLYEWDYTSDGVYDYISERQGTVDHLYSTAGEYTATFRVTDNLGRQSKASMRVQISASGTVYVPPVTSTTTATSTTPGANLIASLVESISGTTGRVVTLSGAVASLAPGTSVVSYEWDYTTDGVYDYISPNQSSVDHLYTTPATYIATFRVTDSLNRKSTASMRVYIIQVASTSTSTTTPPSDTTGPVISRVEATRVSQTSAQITWTTDEPSDTQLYYGLSTAYGSITPLNPALVIPHSVFLSDLTSDNAYYCKLSSTDKYGNKSEYPGVIVSVPASCSETDGGQDYYKKGTTTGWMPAAIGSGSNDDRYVQMTDSCRSVYADGSDPNWVQEYLCTSSGTTPQGRRPYITQASFYCPNGCRDGACQ